MFEELRSGVPRAQSYWAQQLAFGPVFFNVIALAVRRGVIPSNDLELVRLVVPLAQSMLGALPDGTDGDPASFFLLAQRQAQALSVGRRRHLSRLAVRLGMEPSGSPYDPVPRRFQRPYELIGWTPPSAESPSASIEKVQLKISAPEPEPPQADQAGWIDLSKRALARAYGDSEPEYSIADVQMPVSE